jgi:hypothetical protein
MVALLALVVGARGARASFELVSQSLTLDRATGRANFTLHFNQPPDFTTIDSFDRPANSFQIEFQGRVLPNDSSYPQDLTAILRGDEIHVAHGLRIRRPTGNGGPGSGGWGPIIDTVPIDLGDDTVRFSTSLNDLGVSGRGAFEYSVYSLEFGSLTSIQQVASVPLRSALAMFPAAALLAAVVMWRMRRVSSRRSRY